MKRTLIISALLASTLAPACGSGSSASTATAASRPRGGQFCDLAQTFVAQNQTFGNSLTDPTKVKDPLHTLVTGVAVLASAAPDGIKGDVLVIQSNVNDFAAALKSVNYNFFLLPPDISKQFNSAAFQNAEKHLDAYLEGTCGFTPSASTAP